MAKDNNHRVAMAKSNNTRPTTAKDNNVRLTMPKDNNLRPINNHQDRTVRLSSANEVAHRPQKPLNSRKFANIPTSHSVDINALHKHTPRMLTTAEFENDFSDHRSYFEYVQRFQDEERLMMSLPSEVLPARKVIKRQSHHIDTSAESSSSGVAKILKDVEYNLRRSQNSQDSVEPKIHTIKTSTTKLLKSRSSAVEDNYVDFGSFYGDIQPLIVKKNGGKNTKSHAKKYSKQNTVDESAFLPETSHYATITGKEYRDHMKPSKSTRGSNPEYETLKYCDSSRRSNRETRDTTVEYQHLGSKKRQNQKRAEDVVIDYTDIAKRYKENARHMRHMLKHALTEIEEPQTYVLKDTRNRRDEKITRRHTMDRGVKLPRVRIDESTDYELDSSDSPSPTPYYNVFPKKDKFKTPSSTPSPLSLDRAEVEIARDDNWKPVVPKRMDSLTVDRRSYKKDTGKENVRRNTSFSIGSDAKAVCDERIKYGTVGGSTKSCNVPRTPLLNSRKNSKQISAEDMVQIANGGARNKNGSLCHFITVNDDNYMLTGAMKRSAKSDIKMYESFNAQEQRNVYYLRAEGKVKPRSSLSLKFPIECDDSESREVSPVGKVLSSDDHKMRQSRIVKKGDFDPKVVSETHSLKRLRPISNEAKPCYPTCDSDTSSQNSLDGCQCLTLDPHPKMMDLGDLNLITFRSEESVDHEFKLAETLPESFDF